ncbi:DUF3168 domain-containing protein [Pseudooctadecabacter jejudonensis]|uniref:Gene transfer agent protein n=1 Tax=Pseudooctadecabacter jejudonensis TaxID=1391910 RepID=A0A1Y5TGC7_9RHOB|nr:DUF3168 domain-containing protein [Pseudooctadecabacter jejudonensis]SLN59786.1 hypothetical protein PSJ8397_03182 [Pseudooctadecabacter jejudonensis]
MSYGVSAALQSAVYQALINDTALGAVVGDHVYDALPSGSLPPLYVALGPEQVKDLSDKTGAGAMHQFTISVVTDTAGFATAKQAAGAVSDVLVDADLTLTRGQLIALNFYRAKAVRVGTADERRIDVTFNAIVQDN